MLNADLCLCDRKSWKQVEIATHLKVVGSNIIHCGRRLSFDLIRLQFAGLFSAMSLMLYWIFALSFFIIDIAEITNSCLYDVKGFQVIILPLFLFENANSHLNK